VFTAAHTYTHTPTRTCHVRTRFHTIHCSHPFWLFVSFVFSVWDPISDPIALRYVPEDQDVPDALKQIPASGSEKLDKAIKVIVYLLREVRYYEEEADLKVYSPLSLVLDCEGDQVAEEEGLPQAQFARMLDLLNVCDD
jgi:hypothetical protein